MEKPIIAESRIDEALYPSTGLVIVTGSRGQDGSYLRDLIGHTRTIGCINPRDTNGRDLSQNEISIDLGDKREVLDLLRLTRPTAVFHLAAKHGPSTKMTFDRDTVLEMKKIHVQATRNFLECIEKLGLDTHLVVAGSSRVFTPLTSSPLTVVNELSKPNPTDYYGESKLEAWELVKDFRRESDALASYLILFNHESPRRPPGYFSQDVAKAIQNFQSGRSKEILVRDADFIGDWSDARDVTSLMCKVAKSPIGEDFVVASGNLQSVRNLVNSTLNLFGLDQIPVKSTSPLPTHITRNFLQADNSKSVGFGHWTERFQIHRTIFEIINSNKK